MSTFIGMPRAVDTEHLHGTEAFPAAARRALADTQLRRNLGKATATIRAKRAAVVGEVPDWAAAAGGRRGDQGRHAGALRRATCDRLEAEVTARGGHVHWARDAAEANRIVVSAGAGDRRRRGGQGQVDGHPGDRAQRGAGGGRDRGLGDRPGRADRAARARQALAHPGAGDPPQPGRDPGHLPPRDARRGPRRCPTSRPCWPTRPGGTCGGSSCPRRVAVSGANFAVADDRHAGGGGVRGQRADVPDPAARR